MSKGRDAFDYASSLVIPIVAIIVGLVTWRVDTVRDEFQTQSEYVDDLGETNVVKQGVAIDELMKCAHSNSFDPRIVEMLQDLRNDLSSNNPQIENIDSILSLAGDLDQAATPTQINESTSEQKRSDLKDNLIYIQVANESEKPNAQELLSVLQNHSALLPGIQVVNASPNETQVRWFNQNSRQPCLKIEAILTSCGYKPQHQKMSTGFPSDHNIEVWISQNDNPKTLTCTVPNLN